MHILKRVIAAGALVVPMALGAAGVAVADVAADRSVLPAQSSQPADRGSDSCRHDSGGFLGILGGGGNDCRRNDCRRDDSRRDDSRGYDSHESGCGQDDNSWRD